MLEQSTVIAALGGFALGFSLYFALGVVSGKRFASGRGARELRRAHAHEDLQRCIFDVQDAVAMGLSLDTVTTLRTARDRALTAYIVALTAEV